MHGCCFDSLVCPPFRRYEPIGYPLSVHLYFYDDRFQGYLVRQEVQNPGTKVRETLEVWAVPQATLVLEANLKEFERLKNLEVSSTEPNGRAGSSHVPRSEELIGAEACTNQQGSSLRRGVHQSAGLLLQRRRAPISRAPP